MTSHLFRRHLFTHGLFVVLAAGLLACSGRPLPAGDDGGTPPDTRSLKTDAPQPGQRCRSDVECPSGEVCRCTPDPSCPMCPVCNNTCVPAEPCSDRAEPLKVSIGMRGDAVWVRLRNSGCKPLYQLQGCCGEGSPAVEELLDGVGWRTATCVQKPGDCCTMPPRCVELSSGAEREFRLRELERCQECQGTFHVVVEYFETPGCTLTMERPRLTATSAPLDVSYDGCDD